MAWLEQKPSGIFHLVFRIGEEKYRRSLKTKDKKEASSRCNRVEENLRLVESGRLEIPETVDVPSFLLSDGKLNGKIRPRKSITLGKLFEHYKASLPDGALEANTLRIEAVHMRHVVRIASANQDLRTVSLEDLQRHINVRSKEPGQNGSNVSAVTIKKELSTLRTICNWAKDNGYVSKALPSRGLNYPKMDEKPPFKTRSEIDDEILTGCLSDDEAGVLWQCLYLRASEITKIVEVVKGNTGDGFLYPMLALAAYTGARRSELCRSQTRDINLKQGTIQIREKKRDKSRRTTRQVPIAAPLREVLEHWLSSKAKSRFTFPGESNANQSRQTADLVGAIDPDEASYHLNKALSETNWSCIRGWHVFRHSFISNCASLGVDQRMIDDWVGHQTDDQRRRYRHLFPDVQAAAIDRVFTG